MDAIELLSQQHRATEDLFEQLESASAADEQQRLAQTVVQELRWHTTIEEEIFYPAVRAQGGDLEAHVLEDLEEHHAVEMLLDELEGMSPDDERFLAKATVVKELVLHHVEEEEQEQFPEVRDALGEERLADLGARMKQRYEELQQLGSDEPTKEDLYRRAQELDIEGRSSMSKRQLATAITQAASDGR